MLYQSTDECPLPSGSLNPITLTDGTYTITENVEHGVCKTFAIMIAENHFWDNRIESLVVNLDNR